MSITMTLQVLIALFVISGCSSVPPTPGASEQILPSPFSEGENGRCPTWHYHNGTQCECGTAPEGGGVLCDGSKPVLLMLGSCMIYDLSHNSTFYGDCPFSSTITFPESSLEGNYIQLPQDVLELNEVMCGRLNRTGLLCSQCKPGLGPAVLSYKLLCLECLSSPYGWLLYIFLACFPTTVFFFIVITFQVHSTSAPMNFVVFLCQYLSVNINRITPFQIDDSKLFGFLTTSYGVWNLEFFRYFIPPFCVSNNLTTVHVLALEYVVALFPLLLIVLTYICIELHAKDCKLIVCMWRPFNVCFARLRRRWDPRATIIHAFATYLLLSYTKMLFVSFSLLVLLRKVFNVHEEMVGQNVVYYDASVHYFSIKHLPFAILALFILFTFILIPLLFLCLYPTRVFQRCLGYCRIRWHAIHAFAEAFNGCYKDGTKGTRDYRYFGGFYLLLRIVCVLVGTGSLHFYVYLAVLVIVGITANLVFLIFRPYKDNWFNILDGVWLALLSIAALAGLYKASVEDSIHQYRENIYVHVMLQLIWTLPLTYFTLFVVSKLLLQTGLVKHRNCCQKLRTLMERFTVHQNTHEHPTSDTDLADRMINPEQYRNLLPSGSYQEEGLDIQRTIPTYGAM